MTTTEKWFQHPKKWYMPWEKIQKPCFNPLYIQKVQERPVVITNDDIIMTCQTKNIYMF